ncbi:MAG: ASF1 anti-silencing function 1 [Paramarteilia canceri]
MAAAVSVLNAYFQTALDEHGDHENLKGPIICEKLADFVVEILCSEKLQESLHFKLLFVTDAMNSKRDQVLDSVTVDPLEPGNYKFTLKPKSIDPKQMNYEDAIGVTLIILQCSYKNEIFSNVGFIFKTFYEDEQFRDVFPNPHVYDKIIMEIINEPKRTDFNINWDNITIDIENKKEMNKECEEKNDEEDEAAISFDDCSEADEVESDDGSGDESIESGSAMSEDKDLEPQVKQSKIDSVSNSSSNIKDKENINHYF